MPKYRIKADFTGQEWGHCFGYVEADTKEEAVKIAEDGFIDWEEFKVYDSELTELSDFEVLDD